jgi:Rad3-related DNA helicase
MEFCRENWSKTTTINGIQKLNISQELLQSKPIFTEPRNVTDCDTVMKAHHNAISENRIKGSHLMAVFRGKISEGLDFKDDNGRAVVCFGVPFPNMTDPKVILKQAYLN